MKEVPHPTPLPKGEGEERAAPPLPAGEEEGRTAPPLPLGEGRGEGRALGQDRDEGRRLVLRARTLRRESTPAERKLWNALRNNAVGAKCRRQSPLGPYVLDFLFFTERLAIEVDGESHNAASVLARDMRRDAWLRAHGVRVLRFTNRDVLTNLEGVVTAIRMALSDPRPLAEHPDPFPGGEGEERTAPPLPLGEGRGEGGEGRREGTKEGAA